MLLLIDDVSVKYGGIKVLRNISLELDEAGFVGVLGPNGSGKSTLIKTVSGIKPSERGKILFENKRIDNLGARAIFSLGVVTVPEGRKLFPRMSVLENLLMGANLRKDRKDILRSLAKVYEYYPTLEIRQKQKAQTLSGGEQQMVAIGRALMAQAKVILLDEPSVGLAPFLVTDILAKLKDISEAGTAVLIAEQNASETLKVIKRGYILENGRMTLEGSAEEIAADENIRRAYLGG